MNASRMPFTDAASMVDLDRYPIADLTSREAGAFAQKCHREYVSSGLCMLPGFVREEALAMLADEARGFMDKAYFCKSAHNAYLTENGGDSTADDVSHRMEETYVGSVAYDLIDEDAALKRLYNWDPLKDFIAAVLGKPVLHRFADMMGACSVNVFKDGGEHGWHFDESEFTVTLMLQPPEQGGAFEFVPKIRGLPDEKAIVAKVLDGERDGVIELPFTAGTLLIFGGNQTIHRVTKVHGNRPRLVPVLCYAEEPGRTNSPEVRKLFWGRTGLEADA